jgi:hypothetical protein
LVLKFIQQKPRKLKCWCRTSEELLDWRLKKQKKFGRVKSQNWKLKRKMIWQEPILRLFQVYWSLSKPPRELNN